MVQGINEGRRVAKRCGAVEGITGHCLMAELLMTVMNYE